MRAGLVLLLGWVPQLMAPVGWALVAVMVLVSSFGELLALPSWLVAVSPLSHVASMPVEPSAALPVAVLVVLALAGVAGGLSAAAPDRRAVTVHPSG